MTMLEKAPLESLRLQFQLEDGSTLVEEVSLDFSDLTPTEFVEIVVLSGKALRFGGEPGEFEMDEDAWAAILFTKLRRNHQEWGSDYFDAVRAMVSELSEGRGVTV